jgi:hypothetical protein
VGKFKNYIIGLVAAAALVACSGHSPTYVAQPLPDAYGEGGHCYYVSSVAEVAALQARGDCPSNWTPMLMPAAWHARYYWYYDTPRYYNTYVPVAYRTTYRTNMQAFQRSNATLIAQQKQVYGSSRRTTTSARIVRDGSGTYRAPTTRTTTRSTTTRSGSGTFGSSRQSGRR